MSGVYLESAYYGDEKSFANITKSLAKKVTAGVLDVTRRVRDDKFPFRCGEVAVGDIDRDALFALGFEAIGEEGEVYVFITAAARGFLHGFELVFEDGFGIVKEAADESGFAVIDGAGGSEAKEVHGKC